MVVGMDWSGEVRTSTDVSEVDLDTTLFICRARQAGPGHFTFRYHLLDVPPAFVRTYELRVLARTKDGRIARASVPLKLIGREP